MAARGVIRSVPSLRIKSPIPTLEGAVSSVRRRKSMFASPETYVREAVVDSALRSQYQHPSVWFDAPTVTVADPLHPSGFDFKVDLDQAPSTTTGVAGFVNSQPLDARRDPFDLVQGDIVSLSSGMKQLLGSDHPVLEMCAQHFFDMGDGGKKIRPTMVLLMSLAMNHGSRSEETYLPQRRLAEIVEMIHTASLFHDDVIDKADTRRGAPSANSTYGNKLAILAGDFLLARTSVALARLRSHEVVELMSTVIEHLVKGEVMQMKGGHLKDVSALEYYLYKNYYKTGSLMANSCKAAAVLGNHEPQTQEIAFAYGKHIGLAFQLVDDVLDFEGSSSSLGKPALADLNAGLATAPVLLAVEEYPHLQKLIDRKFKQPGDVEEAVTAVEQSGGLSRTKALAIAQADLAIDTVHQLPPSQARDALAHLAYLVVARNR